MKKSNLAVAVSAALGFTPQEKKVSDQLVKIGEQIFLLTDELNEASASYWQTAVKGIVAGCTPEGMAAANPQLRATQPDGTRSPWDSAMSKIKRANRLGVTLIDANGEVRGSESIRKDCAAKDATLKAKLAKMEATDATTLGKKDPSNTQESQSAQCVTVLGLLNHSATLRHEFCKEILILADKVRTDESNIAVKKAQAVAKATAKKEAYDAKVQAKAKAAADALSNDYAEQGLQKAA